MGGIIHAGTNTVMNWTFHATCKLGLKSGVMHLTCPSIVRVYDSDRSKDAVTLIPRYNSVTSHSERNSIILASSLGRMFWVALNAGSKSGICAVVGTPTVRLAYSSAKRSRHILETHWLGFSMSIVILARDHGSGNVDRQCSSSDVSSGAITGSSPSFGRYCMAVVALPLLRCVWVLAACHVLTG